MCARLNHEDITRLSFVLDLRCGASAFQVNFNLSNVLMVNENRNRGYTFYQFSTLFSSLHTNTRFEVKTAKFGLFTRFRGDTVFSVINQLGATLDL